LKYEYEILRPGSTEEIAARFSTTEPLAHIQAGHRLMVVNPEHVTQTGPNPVIEAVEVYLFVSEAGIERTRVSVFLRGVSGLA
jgi:hypothetical protein